MSGRTLARTLAQTIGVLLVTATLLALVEIAAGFFVEQAKPPAPTPEIPGDTVSRTVTWLEVNPAPLVRDAELLWRNEPNARKTQPVNPQPWGANLTWTIENNSEGFRGAERPAGADGGVFRILCVGDSITFGFNVDQPDTYPRRLQALLDERHPGRRIEVVNTGVPGWSWLQGLRFLELQGFGLHPNLVIQGHGTNDQALPAKVTDEERFHRLGGPVTRAMRAAALRLTASNSYRLVERFFPPPPFSPDADSPACKKQIAVTGGCRRVSVDEIDTAVGEVAALTRDHGVGLLLVNLDFVETPAVTGLRRAAARGSLPFIDVVDRMRARRRQADDARSAALALAPATAPDVYPSDTPPALARARRATLRVRAPDRDAAYEFRGSALFGESFQFTEPAYDDGTHGDERAGDGVYSATIEVPANIGRLRYLAFRNGEPELKPLPPMASSVGDRLMLVTTDVLGPVDTFGELVFQAERAHPNREGQQLVAEMIAAGVEADPAFRRFVGAR
jgi:lysophospholipase L1-like esterase